MTPQRAGGACPTRRHCIRMRKPIPQLANPYHVSHIETLIEYWAPLWVAMNAVT
ncbi:hypothetical protein [Pararhodobacter sp.]|uniref:hypothetical protein n=1 Tax=Pararhodobacter sp. TaxID=2127056 RepID=UPI002AFF01D5|nr:hypothetical protein [Pararhodobacter sp.]